MSSYPVGYEADFAVERSRLTTFFRLILYIPVAIVAYFYGLVGFFTWIGAFFAVLFTGRYPEGLYAFNGNLVRFVARSSAYQRLITDEFPPLGLDEHPEYPVRVPIAPAQEHYSRLKVLFRFLLGIPVMI
ncbi:MAG: hypothetical protein JWM71_882, partial [Solirubrobacteraceae bacterium]|nr:hypothetical protein [Solirubrobacteraceae bacterium]